MLTSEAETLLEPLIDPSPLSSPTMRRFAARCVRYSLTCSLPITLPERVNPPSRTFGFRLRIPKYISIAISNSRFNERLFFTASARRSSAMSSGTRKDDANMTA